MTLELDAARFGPAIIDELKSVFANFPGETEVVLVMRTREGSAAPAVRPATTAWRRRPGCGRSSTSCSASLSWRPERSAFA